MTSTSGDGPAPGWYPDPHDRAQQRYWDGDAWTEHRHPATSDSSAGQGPEDTAVLPRVEQPTSRPPEPASTSKDSRGGAGWVPALVGLLVGLIIGGTAAAVVVGNNDDSSSPKSDSSSATSSPPSTATATTTATATESVTATATATVTVTESASP
jgi:hypothetical protein